MGLNYDTFRSKEFLVHKIMTVPGPFANDAITVGARPSQLPSLQCINACHWSLSCQNDSLLQTYWRSVVDGVLTAGVSNSKISQGWTIHRPQASALCDCRSIFLKKRRMASVWAWRCGRSCGSGCHQSSSPKTGGSCYHLWQWRYQEQHQQVANIKPWRNQALWHQSAAQPWQIQYNDRHSSLATWAFLKTIIRSCSSTPC